MAGLDEAGRRRIVRELAAAMPADLRDLRGRAMLDDEFDYLGVEERACPGCAGTGWLDRAGLERCPVCCGFRELPGSVADWFAVQFACATQLLRKPMLNAMLVGLTHRGAARLSGEGANGL